MALIAVLGSSSNPSFAQERRDTLFGEPWTLDRCVEYALENNIDIKRKELVRETKEVAVSEGKWAYLPSVYFSTGGSGSSGRVLDQTTYEFIKNSTVGSSSSSIAGSLNLFSGMSRVYALQRAKLDLQSESASLESLKYDVRKSVTAAFLAALCAEADYQSALRAKALLESQLERIVFLVDAGKVTESDRLQAKAQLYAAECDMDGKVVIEPTSVIPIIDTEKVYYAQTDTSDIMVGDGIYLPLIPNGFLPEIHISIPTLPIPAMP